MLNIHFEQTYKTPSPYFTLDIDLLLTKVTHTNIITFRPLDKKERKIKKAVTTITKGEKFSTLT